MSILPTYTVFGGVHPEAAAAANVAALRGVRRLLHDALQPIVQRDVSARVVPFQRWCGIAPPPLKRRPDEPVRIHAHNTSI